MASSLAQLLLEDGFKGGRSRIRTWASFKPETRTHNPSHERHDSGSSSSSRTKTNMTVSNVPRKWKSEQLRYENSSSRRYQDGLITAERKDYLSSYNMLDKRVHDVDSSENVPGSEIVEVGVKEDKGKEKQVYEGYSVNLNKNLQTQTGYRENNRMSMKQVDAAKVSSAKSSKNYKGFEEEDKRRKVENVGVPISRLALDEVAVQAMISILNSYVKSFLGDKELREGLHETCFSSLDLSEIVEDRSVERRVVLNLEEAIEVVENAAEGKASPKDLKKASLQLSVITGLSSDDLKDGYTSGIPNSRLSACAHLYLSVIYKLQKKDRISAKHLLQVFCESPCLARTVLLPHLWDYLFFPHLSHLKIWYNQESDSLPGTPNRLRKLKLLEKVYNEILDSGTYQFAAYYKDWLTEGVEPPSVPLINIPSVSVRRAQQEDSHVHSMGDSPASPFWPSKNLYDSMLGHSNEPEAFGAEDELQIDNHAIGHSTYFSEINYLDQESEKHSFISAHEDELLHVQNHLSESEEDWQVDKESASTEVDLNDEKATSDARQETEEDVDLKNASSPTKANELALKSLALSVFDLQESEDSDDLHISSLSYPTKPIKGRASYEEFQGSYEYPDEESISPSIPLEFVCPLSGQVMEDPLTLETGQTYEREAIKEWFNQGHRTCPVTGRTMQNLTLPLTNLILKRIIDSWRLKNPKSLTDCKPRQSEETAIFMLEKLVTTLNSEERLANSKHLIVLGGLEFLIGSFKRGSLEEKTCVAAILSCCIEADISCREQIAKTIDKQGLLELLHRKQFSSRRNAVFLLTEIVCLSRRKDLTMLFSGIESEKIMNAMHVLLLYLQSSPPEQRPLVAVLILHLDLLVEPRKYSLYREEAVNAIAVALETSLTDKKVKDMCCRSLLVLGGRVSDSGKLSTERWILKQAGISQDDDNLSSDEAISFDEEKAQQEWLRNLSMLLLRDGKMSVLQTISKCLSSGIQDLSMACLITIAWLSSSISTQSDAEFQLSAFFALFSGLKDTLDNGKKEQQVLASMSLLNFSKIPECRVLLMTIAEEIAVPLKLLSDIAWTAKQLNGKRALD
ncbi:hypothetical protein K2173_021772 [Erythroxylum novogranatense]|uniref:RING-type E3 ubiquitin transferase n=1 Tax=Erythroxylum novogranatense TaxID=1862640 RepID=A0AAV8TV04_9ROSI|nr:hypothetical protein K2173_021772 [Erythroxylum novogranatense]